MSDETVYRITPKGVMALFLTDELGLSWEEALEQSAKLEDMIFKVGYIYAHESEIEVR